MIEVGKEIPYAVFRKRVHDESIQGDNPFKWIDIETQEIFKNRRVLVFALPGAFTPTCSTYQVPDFVEQREAIKALGIDEIYVLSVNDTFVMRKWLIDLDALDKIDFLPDGAAEFTKGMDMVVDLSNIGFGKRSRRYAMVVDDGKVEQAFVEPDATEENPDPYGESSPELVLKYLKEVDQKKRLTK